MQVHIAILNEILKHLQRVQNPRAALILEDLLEDGDGVPGSLGALVDECNGAADGLDGHALLADLPAQHIREGCVDVVGG